MELSVRRSTAPHRTPFRTNKSAAGQWGLIGGVCSDSTSIGESGAVVSAAWGRAAPTSLTMPVWVAGSQSGNRTVFKAGQTDLSALLPQQGNLVAGSARGEHPRVDWRP